MRRDHTIRTLLTLMTICALLLSVGAGALAERAYVRGSATVYSEPSESASGQGQLKKRTEVELVAEKDGWAQVRKSGRTAYVKSADLIREDAAEEQVQRTTVYTAKDNTPVYNASGKAIASLPANTALTLTGVKGKVCRVEHDGHTAYVMKADLSQTQVERQESETVEETTEEKSVTVYVSRDDATVYSAKGKATGTLSLNTAVTVTAVRKGICRVSWSGHTGYMRKSDLSTEKTAEKVDDMTRIDPVKGYVCTDGAKVYDAAGKTVATLKLNAAVTVSAYNDKMCKVTSGSVSGYMRRADIAEKKTEEPSADEDADAGDEPSGDSTVKPAKGTAVEMDWWDSDIQTIFARGVIAQITDVETGLSWREKRFGGTNHADCQPLTAADTAAMKQAYGGTWSWKRRAVFVTINGVNYAASINGMPHGSGSISDNNFNGHHCIHFTNSRTHGSNKVCPLHQAAIKQAASTTLY